MGESDKKPLQDGVFRSTRPLYPDVPPPVNPYAPIDPIPLVNTVGQGTAPVLVPTTLYPPVVGPKPCRITCTSCHQQVVTRVEYTANMRTHLMALILCVVGCLPCMCIPYCVDSCKSADHYCTYCGNYVGQYQGNK